MKLLNSRPSKKRNSHTKNLAPESLETRRLMAADAFHFETIDHPVVAEVHAEVRETVDELAEAVLRDVEPLQLQLAQENGQPEILLEHLAPHEFQQIVDAAEIPELGPVLGQNQTLENSLTDLVIMDLMQVPEQSDAYSQQMNFFLNELNCEIQFFVPIDGTTDEQLPPQFEQLRQELGDENFAEWLQQNLEQTGTFAGISADQIGELSQPEIQQIDQQEAVLHAWLRQHTESHQPLDLPEQFEILRTDHGDRWLGLWLESNATLFGNLSGLPEQAIIELEVVDPGLQGLEFQEQALQHWLEQLDEAVILPLPGEEILLEIPTGFDGQLPPAMEQMRLALGNESFAQWLESNLETIWKRIWNSRPVVDDRRTGPTRCRAWRMA